jgi:hypothetical protein
METTKFLNSKFYNIQKTIEIFLERRRRRRRIEPEVMLNKSIYTTGNHFSDTRQSQDSDENERKGKR